MKNTYGDADTKDSTEIAAILRAAQLENELAALRAENARLRELLAALTAESATMCRELGRDVKLVAQIQDSVRFLQSAKPVDRGAEILDKMLATLDKAIEIATGQKPA